MQNAKKPRQTVDFKASLAGLESPGALEYFPKEVQKSVPAYSFGAKGDRKPESRAQLLKTSTPRQVGPGSHQATAAMGKQAASPRRTAPAWTMSARSPRDERPGGRAGEHFEVEHNLRALLGR